MSNTILGKNYIKMTKCRLLKFLPSMLSDKQILTFLQDDRWRPMNHLNEKECVKFVDEMAAVGIDLKQFVYGRCLAFNFQLVFMNSSKVLSPLEVDHIL